jgi:hypothetical protein
MAIPITATLITVYQADDTDGDRRCTPRYFLKEAEAHAYVKEGGGYRSYVGPKQAVRLLDEDDNDSETFHLVTDITMSMDHINKDALREQALSKLTRAERAVLGLPDVQFKLPRGLRR